MAEENDTTIAKRNGSLWPSGRTDGADDSPGDGAGTGDEAGKEEENTSKRRGLGQKWLLFYVILLVANYLIFSVLVPRSESIEVPYTVFREEVEAGNVEEIYVEGDAVEGAFAEPVTYPAEGEQEGEGPRAEESQTAENFTTAVPAFADPGLENLLVEQNVQISAEPIQQEANSFLTLLLSFLPALLIIGVIVWSVRRSTKQMGGGAGGMFGLGSSKAKRYDKEEGAQVTFEDVAGIEEAQEELAEIVDFLKQPERYTRLGGAAPKGVLLVGAPGTGKTLLAKAVAGEAEVPFFSMSASEFIEMVVGVGARRVRDLFKEAREAAPAIIFIDELDAIGRARGRNVMSGGTSEQEQTLNQILTEMDGFSSREGVIVLAATNQPEVLDGALMRPGRFDRRVTVQAPDRRGREAILKVHTRSVPLSEDVDLEKIASTTPGLVGADLRNLVNEAALTAARRGRDEVRHQDFLDALEKITLGAERNIVLSEADRLRTAHHESGHAILGIVVPGSDPVNRMTIVPRGQALGVTYQRPDDDRYNYSEEYLRSRMIMALGGRVAEEIIYGDRTTGAESDFQQVTQIARGMVTRWGMSDDLGTIAYAPQGNAFLGEAPTGYGEGKPYSEATARAIDAEVQKIVADCYEEATRLLEEHRPELEALTHALIERETLDEAEILAVTGLSPAGGGTGTPRIAGQNGSSTNGQTLIRDSSKLEGGK